MHLLKNILEESERDLGIEEFDLNEVGGRRRGEETRKIDWLNKPAYPGDVLIKAEGGRTFLKRTLSSSVNDFITDKFHLNVLADFDHRSVQDWIDDVNERLDYTRNMRIRTIDQNYDCAILSGYECGIFIEGGVVDSFGLIGFKQKMEDAVGIDKGIHDSDDKEQLINEFTTENSDIRIAFERSFN